MSQKLQTTKKQTSKLNPAQLALQERCRPHAAGVEAGRWALAKEALQAKREHIPQWERVIGELPDVRRKDRTIRGWAQTMEWREIVIKQGNGYNNLPFSHYSIVARYCDLLPVSVLLEAMEMAEQEEMKYEELAVLLVDLAWNAAGLASESDAGGGIPPSIDGAQDDYGLTPLQFVQREGDRLRRVAALPEFAPIMFYMSRAIDAMDDAMTEFGKVKDA